MQVPKPESAPLAEAKSAMTEHLRLTRARLQSVGFAVGEGPGSSGDRVKGPVSGGPSGRGPTATAGTTVSSSVLNQDEQRRFLENMRPR